MELWSEEACQEACVVQWQAENVAGVHRRGGAPRLLSVPRQWTAWLLMSKAGVPAELIAYVSYADPREVRRKLRIAAALMVLAPYAAHIEALMQRMPHFGATRLGEARQRKREAACAVAGR
jgi:hypothetical protein